MNCPACGKKREINQSDIFIALLCEAGAKTSRSFEFCQCPPDIKPPIFIKGNWLTENRALRKGDIWVAIWRSHNLPEMRDCRDLDYKYAVNSNDRIICEAVGDYYDITDEVLATVN